MLNYSRVSFELALISNVKLLSCRANQLKLLNLRNMSNSSIPLNLLAKRSGVVLLRGFLVSTASDFNNVVEAFGFEELPYVGEAAPRTSVVGQVFTANESPLDQKIPSHGQRPPQIAKGVATTTPYYINLNDGKIDIIHNNITYSECPKTKLKKVVNQFSLIKLSIFSYAIPWPLFPGCVFPCFLLFRC
jgi:hypothetical protein